MASFLEPWIFFLLPLRHLPKNRLGLFKTLHFQFQLDIECIAGFLLQLWVPGLFTTLKKEATLKAIVLQNTAIVRGNVRRMLEE